MHPLMDANILNMVKIQIIFDEPVDGIWGENLWATPLKNGNYRLENQPLCEGLQHSDIVKASYVDGFLKFESFVMRDASIQVER